MLKFIIIAAVLLSGMSTGWMLAATDSEQSPPQETQPDATSAEPIEPVEHAPLSTKRSFKATGPELLQQLRQAWESGGQAAVSKCIDRQTPNALAKVNVLLKERATKQLADSEDADREFVEFCRQRMLENISIAAQVRQRRAEMSVPFGQAVDAFPGENRWPIYDTTMYIGKPDFFQKGYKPIHMAGGRGFFKTDLSDEPDEQLTRQTAREFPTDRPVCIDIERLSMQPDQLDATIDKLLRVCKWIREENPNVRFGFYGTAPLRSYWAPLLQHRLNAAQRPASGERATKYRQRYEQWQQTNQRLGRLTEHVDFIFPSLYTFYDDPPNWQIYAEANIAAARQYGKPVITFLMPTYHISNPKLVAQPLGAEYWRTQLRTVRPLTDGAVIWMGPIGRMQWEDWQWWHDVMVQEGLVLP